MKNKFAMELKLAFGRKPWLVEHEVAEQAYISKGQLSKIKNGFQRADPQLRWKLARIINDIWLNYLTAALNNHTISFRQNRISNGDMFSALMDQRNEQAKREKLEPEFEQAMAIQPKFRTPAQNQIIDQYPKEYAQEISSEITDLIKKAQYAGISMTRLQQVIDEVNGVTAEEVKA